MTNLAWPVAVCCSVLTVLVQTSTSRNRDPVDAGNQSNSAIAIAMWLHAAKTVKWTELGRSTALLTGPQRGAGPFARVSGERSTVAFDVERHAREGSRSVPRSRTGHRVRGGRCNPCAHEGGDKRHAVGLVPAACHYMTEES